MLDGAQFVEALGRLGYPDASSLKASEFDWLFDCAPENLHFLRFVCWTLNRSNVLTTEEALAFQELQKTGKPILDEAALGKALKTITPSDGSSANILGAFSSSSSMFATDEDLSIEDLEAELQGLYKERELKQRRYNKLQVMVTSRANVELQLTRELDSIMGELKETSASVGAVNTDTNTLLKNLTEEVSKLASYLPQPEDKQKGDPVVQSKPVSLMPTSLLSQLSLDPYLHQEELNTKTLAAFTQKQFSQGISDIIETSCSERFQVLDLSSCEEEEEKELEGEKGKNRIVDRKRTEMARLQWSHIVAQHQLMQATAEEKGVKAGLNWLSEKACHTKVNLELSVCLYLLRTSLSFFEACCYCPGLLSKTFSTISHLYKSFSTSSSLHVREVVSRKDLQAVEAEVEALLHGPVPAALRESARLLNVPIVRGDLALQLARQDYCTSRQDQVSI